MLLLVRPAIVQYRRAMLGTVGRRRRWRIRWCIVRGTQCRAGREGEGESNEFVNGKHLEMSDALDHRLLARRWLLTRRLLVLALTRTDGARRTIERRVRRKREVLLRPCGGGRRLAVRDHVEGRHRREVATGGELV